MRLPPGSGPDRARLDAASAKGLRAGENPAGGAAISITCCPIVRKCPSGTAAMPFPDVLGYWPSMQPRGDRRAGAEFGVLNASRSGEVLGATWSEMDRKAKVWTIPAARMKGGIEHRVPLSARALEILDKAETIRTGDQRIPWPEERAAYVAYGARYDPQAHEG